MDKLPFEVPDSLVDNPPKIFIDVKYCIEGTIDPKLTKILENGGAKKLGYFSISATHVLVGEGANDVRLNEADEVFEIPLVEARWVAFCAKAGKLLPIHGFEGGKKLFSALCVTSSGIKSPDLSQLAAVLTYHGGHFQRCLTLKCTHLIKNNCDSSKKYQTAKDRGVKIVCSDWITECVKANSILDEQKFDPQFLVTAEAAKSVTLQTQQLKISQPSSDSVTSKPTKGNVARQAVKTAQAPTSIPPIRPMSSQTAAILQLSGTPGPRGRGTAVRHQNAQQQKTPGGATQIRAHRPLLVNSQQPQQPSKSLPVTLKSGGNATPKGGTTQSPGKTQTTPPKAPAVLQQKSAQQRPVPVVAPPPQVPQTQAQQQQSSQNQPAPLLLPSPQVSQPSVSMAQQPGPGLPMQPQQVQTTMTMQQQQPQQQQVQTTMQQQQQQLQQTQAQQQQIPVQVQQQQQQQLQQQQQQQQLQQQQIPSLQQQQLHLQQQLQSQQNSLQQNHSTLHQQLQQGQLHQQDNIVQQHQQAPSHQPTQLQTALSQPVQPAQSLQSQVGQPISQLQQSNLAIQMQQQQHIQMDGNPPQQFVLQNQLQPQMQQMRPQFQQNTSMQNQQVMPNQQMQYVHHQTLQQQPSVTVPHSQSQVGIQNHQSHAIIQQQGMQQHQRPPPQQGHPMHLQQQQQQMHGPGMQGMQFQHSQQLQPHQQPHGLQQLQQQNQAGQQGNLQQQQVLQSQKSPLPPPSQALQNLANNQQQQQQSHQQMLSQQQQQQQPGLVHQLGMPPQHQVIQNQQQQNYQMQNSQQILQNQLHPQHQQQQQIQNQQQQQFTLPQQSKTPPHQLHPQSPQHHQLMNQQHLQGQVGMRPPQSPQQQSQQPVHFQILQPQNRLQVVMGSQGNPAFQQGQPPTSNSQPVVLGNQQQMFRQQQPLQPGSIQGINKPPGQMFHQLQQHPQPRQQQGIIQMQQTHQTQMQGQPGQMSNPHPQSPIQPILSPQHLQSKQFQEIGPSAGQQLQQGAQHYNVVIHQGQQFTQVTQRPQVQPQPRHPGKPGSMPPQPQMQVGQRVGFPVGAPRPGVHQWTQQQQMEIYRQIQMDPNIKAKWAQMDQQQRQLLVQKLAQRHREDQLRKEMMLRQQQLNQQNATMQGQQQGQVNAQSQVTPSVPGSPHFHAPQNQTGLVQQTLPQAQGLENHMVVSHQGSPTMVSQPAPSPLPQSSVAQGVQLPGSPVVTNAQGQQILMSNHTMLAQQQKLISPQSPSPTQKFAPPSPLQQLQTRASNSMISGPQGPQQGQIIRTQNVFTPQVSQQGQRMVNVQHVVVHQGGAPQQPQQLQQQQQTRFPQQQQIVLQQQHQVLPGHGQPGTPQQKVSVLQAPQQSPGQQVQGGVQWLPGAPQQQRLGSPTQSSPQFSPRMQQGSSEQQRSSPGQVWNTRQHSPIGAPAPVVAPGTPTTGPFVQVVNSKTKTALANLLNNRLQGNSTGTDSSTTSTSSSIATASASTTITMCSPSQNPPTFSSQSQQLPLQHPVSQATSQSLNVISQRTLSNLTNSCKTIHQVSGSFGGAAPPRPTTLSQSPTAISLASPRTPFYGYEPNFKAPANGFLLGCVFWAAQQMDKVNWQEIVAFYGGEVIEEYNSAKVTHVLCKHQRFPELQQVLRDGKRIVTMHWLSDTVSRKVMAPPFYAIHLPTAFNAENMPLKGQAFSITGFEGEDRERLIKMLKLCGADVTLYFTQLNKGLVSCKTDGQKYTKAREWKVPIINIQFLNELLLGSQSCLQMIHAPKYQHFTLEQPFRFDINIAPHLMATWKTPIRVNNDLVERFKSSKRPLEKPIDDNDRAKRIKLEEEEKMQMSYLDELSAGGEPMHVDKKLEDLKPDIENKPPPVIMFTGFSAKFRTLATEKVIELGARITSEPKEATHLIAWEIVTTKLYTALCHVKFIVGAPWIRDSYKAKRFVDEGPYIPKVVTFEDYHKVNIADILKQPDRHLLFKGMTFYITPGLTGTFRQGLESVITAAGGQVDALQKSMSDVKSKARKNPRKYIVITNVEDFEHLSQIFFYKQSKPLSIFTCLFIYKSIADQKVDLGPLPPKKLTSKAEVTVPKWEPM